MNVPLCLRTLILKQHALASMQLISNAPVVSARKPYDFSCSVLFPEQPQPQLTDQMSPVLYVAAV